MPAAPIVITKTIELGLMLYTYMAAQNALDRQAVVEFNSKDFKPSSGDPLDLDSVGSLTNGEVDAICPRFGEVKTRTDLAAERAARIGDYPSTAAYGTAVHKDLSDQIKALADPNLRSEVSYLKSREADRYGQTGSIRIDVLERVGDGSVCVYDIKTGVSGLGAARTGEIAQRVFAAYPETQRIIVTEIRPTR